MAGGNSFRFTHAIVCRLASSTFATGATGAEHCKEALDLDKAKAQLETLYGALRKLQVDVIEMQEDDDSPDCCFVEDLAVVINGTALMTRPALKHRRKEVEYIKVFLQKELPNLQIWEIKDEKAILDGGDVFFTGREIFVGVGDKSNMAGAHAVASSFPEYPTSPIKVPEGVHLKHLVSMAAPGVMAVCSTRDGADVLKRLEREATFPYKTLTLPDQGASNCMHVNGTLIHKSDYFKSDYIFKEKVDFPRYPIEFKEFSKLNATLSSCAILINLPKNIKKM